MFGLGGDIYVYICVGKICCMLNHHSPWQVRKFFDNEFFLICVILPKIIKDRLVSVIALASQNFSFIYGHKLRTMFLSRTKGENFETVNSRLQQVEMNL